MSGHVYRLRALTFRRLPTDTGAPVFDAVCECGWQSPLHKAEVGAQIAADQHAVTAPHDVGAS